MIYLLVVLSCKHPVERTVEAIVIGFLTSDMIFALSSVIYEGKMDEKYARSVKEVQKMAWRLSSKRNPYKLLPLGKGEPSYESVLCLSDALSDYGKITADELEEMLGNVIKEKEITVEDLRRARALFSLMGEQMLAKSNALRG